MLRRTTSKIFILADGRLERAYEETPPGTISAAREALGHADALVVVNADNFISLPLQAFLSFHQQSQAALTIATRQQAFELPFGDLRLAGDQVLQYIDKPVLRTWIAAGTYVIGREACDFLPKGQRMDLPPLVSALLNAGKPVAAFRYKAEGFMNDLESAEVVCDLLLS